MISYLAEDQTEVRLIDCMVVVQLEKDFGGLHIIRCGFRYGLNSGRTRNTAITRAVVES